MTIAEFIDTYLAHLVAVIALVQVWALAAWKRWIVKGRIEFHPAANIEVGFSSFGSTVALPGTLRAVKKEVFVSDMGVTITRLQDQAKHTFTWRAFRSNTFSAASMAPEAIDLATSFNLLPTSPRPINVVYASAEFASRYAQQAEQLRAAWQLFVAGKMAELGDQAASLVNTAGFVDALFGEFSHEQAALDLYTQISNGFYWQAGRYKLDLGINCASPTNSMHYTWFFELTQDDEQKLRLNALVMMKEICSIQVIYNFIYKPYASAT
jgi:hypothetical protein